MNVALIGRNLWMHANAPHIDPETAFSAGNQQGFEMGQLPVDAQPGLPGQRHPLSALTPTCHFI